MINNRLCTSLLYWSSSKLEPVFCKPVSSVCCSGRSVVQPFSVAPLKWEGLCYPQWVASVGQSAWVWAPRAGFPPLKYAAFRLHSTAKCGREEWDSLSRSEISVGEIMSQKWNHISQSVRALSYHTDKQKSPKASLGARCCVFINRWITVGVLCYSGTLTKKKGKWVDWQLSSFSKLFSLMHCWWFNMSLLERKVAIVMVPLWNNFNLFFRKWRLG